MPNSPQIFQICYAPEVRPRLDPGFRMTGDESNPRPEWFEYWHIRNFLKSEILDEDTFYGFLSPRFKEKTNLGSDQVYRFIERHSDSDVILFSPYLDQSALFLNIIEQAWFAHPELKAIFSEICKRYFKNVDHETLVTTTDNTVFCNYFVAKPDFWARWFTICESIYHLVEGGRDPLGIQIAGRTRYKTNLTPMRTFVMERIATLLLCTETHWKVVTHPSFRCSVGKMPAAQQTSALLALDALKRVFVLSNNPEYLCAYFKLRQVLLSAGHIADSAHHQAPDNDHHRYTVHLTKKMGVIDLF